MDQNTLRGLLTLIGLLCFIGIAVWAYSRAQRQAFDEAARLPLDDDEPAVASTETAAPGAGQGTST